MNHLIIRGDKMISNGMIDKKIFQNKKIKLMIKFKQWFISPKQLQKHQNK